MATPVNPSNNPPKLSPSRASVATAAARAANPPVDYKARFREILEGGDVNEATNFIHEWAKNKPVAGSPYHKLGMEMVGDFFDTYMGNDFTPEERDAKKIEHLGKFSEAVASKMTGGVRSAPELTEKQITQNLGQMTLPQSSQRASTAPRWDADRSKHPNSYHPSPASTGAAKTPVGPQDVAKAAQGDAKVMTPEDAANAMRVSAIQTGAENVSGAIGQSQRAYMADRTRPADQLTNKMNDYRQAQWAKRGVTGFAENPQPYAGNSAYSFPTDERLSNQESQDAYNLRLLQRGDITADQMPLYSGSHATRTPAGMKDLEGNYLKSNSAGAYQEGAMRDTGFYDTRQQTGERAYDSQQDLDNFRLSEMIRQNREREAKQNSDALTIGRSRQAQRDTEENTLSSLDGKSILPMLSGGNYYGNTNLSNATQVPYRDYRDSEEHPLNGSYAGIQDSVHAGMQATIDSLRRRADNPQGLYQNYQEDGFNVDNAINGILNPTAGMQGTIDSMGPRTIGNGLNFDPSIRPNARPSIDFVGNFNNPPNSNRQPFRPQPFQRPQPYQRPQR